MGEYRAWADAHLLGGALVISQLARSVESGRWEAIVFKLVD